MAAEYNKKDLVINDIVLKNTQDGWTNRQIKEYLQIRYGYTYETAQKYTEWMWQRIKENVNIDYDEVLASRIEQLSYLAQGEENRFIKLQIYKELDKIQGLHINKIQSNVNINNINTIRIIEVQPSQNQDMLNASNTEAIEVPFTIPIENNNEHLIKSEPLDNDMNLFENENGKEEE